jgi:actin-related protein 9
MPAFLALVHHVHGLLSPGLHTPILLIAQPAWTAQDNEAITQFFFEKFKTPAFCIMDSALAISYAYGSQNATVVDVGYQKTDVTCVYDFSVEHEGRTIALGASGGDAMTERLLELLGPKGWTKDMCEQLKKSSFCEVLPAGVPLPGTAEGKEDLPSNPAAAASTGATSSGPDVKITEAPRVVEIDNDDDLENGEKVIDDDGVLDVASIVTSGKTQEFLAQQERKKAERKAAKDAKAAADAAAVKPVRLPNAKREKVMFHYQDRKSSNETEEVVDNGNKPTEGEVPEPPKEKTPEAATELVPETTIAETAPAPEPTTETAEDANAKRDQARAAKREEKRKARDAADASASRREIEVGTERFLACSGGILDRIAGAIHHTVLGVEPVRRSELWDNLIIVGNGSRVKGFKDALLATLNSKYLISPSSATIFTSELPSNLSTPMGTGAQTPQREFPPGQHPLPTGSSVNPMLLAATTASHQNLGGNLPGGSQYGGQAHGGHGVHSAHSQTPTSIKTVKAPEYFPEFKVCFCTHLDFVRVWILGFGETGAKGVLLKDRG